MKLSEIIESLTRVESNLGDVEVTRIDWIEDDDRWHVNVHYE